MNRNTSPLDLNTIDRTLVIMMGGIGNFILMLPALRALREALREKHITLLIAEPSIAEIARSQNLVDDIILHDRRVSQSFRKKWCLLLDLREKKFDLALVASHTNALKGGLLTFLSGIPDRVGQNIDGKGFFYSRKIPFENSTHETDGVIELVESIGINVNERQPQLKLYSVDQESVQEYLDAQHIKKGSMLIGMHAGSGLRQTFKRWPKERFAELADQLIDQCDASVVLSGSKQEKALNQEIIGMMKGQAINTAGEFSISETATLIKKCALFVSNDSGIAHIAAAVKTPLVVLFGPTDAGRIMPQGENVVIIQRKDEGIKESNKEHYMELIEVNEVYEKITEKLKQVKSET